MRWLVWLWYELTFLTTLFGMTFGFSLRIRGRQHVPLHGPVLLIANHQSFLDPVLVGLSSPRHLIFLARKTLFKHRAFAGLIRSLNAVPIDQEGIGVEGIRMILEQLRRGRAVLVFPEGERTLGGVMHRLKPGIHLLIKRVQAPIVPVGIAGAHAAWARGTPFPIPAPLFLSASHRTVALSVGPAIDGKRFVGVPREQVLDELFQAMQREHENAEHLRRK
ncbi:MAG: 1-acyl-sn-glycerol-3-phosphate acyltransferase [Gemmataceae bacterium]|nr:1-acyl-sn-glycerol-3-phosphate acyltransferase [Gemmataceae bacterium]